MAGVGVSGLADDLVWPVVGCRPCHAGMPQPSVARPLGEPDLTDRLGSHPVSGARVGRGTSSPSGESWCPMRCSLAA
jgi:hypothetical protein